MSGAIVILDPLPAAAEQINEAHRLARQHAETAVQQAIRCGELLIAKKAALQHGEFGAWVQANCEFSYSSARAYMQAAEKQNDSALAFSSLREALAHGKPDTAPAADLASLDLSHVGPPLTDEERDYIAKSPERIGRMIAEFAERQADSERVAAEIESRFRPDQETSRAFERRPERHPVHRGMRYRVAEHEIERGINALTGLAGALTSIDVDALDRERINEWDAELGRQIAKIYRFRRHLRDIAGGRL